MVSTVLVAVDSGLVTICVVVVVVVLADVVLAVVVVKEQKIASILKIILDFNSVNQGLTISFHKLA